MSKLGVLAQIVCKFAPNHFYVTVGNFWVLNFRRKKGNCLFFVKLSQTPLEKYYFSLSKWQIVTDFWKIKTLIAYHIKLIWWKFKLELLDLQFIFREIEKITFFIYDQPLPKFTKMQIFVPWNEFDSWNLVSIQLSLII